MTQQFELIEAREETINMIAYETNIDKIGVQICFVSYPHFTRNRDYTPHLY